MVKTRYPITIEGETTEIGTAAELVVALNVLQGHHDHMVLEQLRPYLSEIIVGPQDLYATLKVLISDDMIYLIDALGSNLVHIVKKASALRDIFAMLSEGEVEEQILKTLGSEGLRSLIHSPADLSGILEWVYESCDQLALQLLGTDFIKRLIQSGYELSLILHSLDHERQKELINMLGWEKVVSLIISQRDLAHLLRTLPSELSKQLLNNFTKDKLWEIIRDKNGWKYLYNYLEAEEASYLSKLLGIKNTKL